MTLESFLLTYAMELTESSTKSLNRLLSMSLNGHARAFEPVALLFVLRGRGDELRKQVRDTVHEDSTRFLLGTVSDKDSLLGLLAGDSRNNDGLLRYRKVYQAYANYENRLSIDRKASLLLRDKMQPIMMRKGISNYRVYTDLSLNPGNVNAFLKNGDASKVSRKTARKMFEYVQSK